MPSRPDPTGEGLPLNRRDFLRLTGLGSLGLLVPGLLTGCGDDAVGVIGSPSYAATMTRSRFGSCSAMPRASRVPISSTFLPRPPSGLRGADPERAG